MPEVQGESQSVERKRVVAIDDDPLVINNISRVVKRTFPDLTIQISDNGRDGLELIPGDHEGADVAAIIADGTMPGLYGPYLFEEVLKEATPTASNLAGALKLIFSGGMPVRVIETMKELVLAKKIEGAVLKDLAGQFLGRILVPLIKAIQADPELLKLINNDGILGIDLVAENALLASFPEEMRPAVLLVRQSTRKLIDNSAMADPGLNAILTDEERRHVL